MTTIDWESKCDDLMDRATTGLEKTLAAKEETIEIFKILRPLVVVDAVVRGGFHPYQGDGAKLAKLILHSLKEGWLRPPVTVETVWRIASMFRNGPVPDWAPHEGDPL